MYLAHISCGFRGVRCNVIVDSDTYGAVCVRVDVRKAGQPVAGCPDFETARVRTSFTKSKWRAIRLDAFRIVALLSGSSVHEVQVRGRIKERCDV